MSIIEKLGITPLEIKYSSILDQHMFFENEVRELETQRDEMLEALIAAIVMNERNGNPIESIYGIVEKSTGKSWKKIKELLP